MENFLVSAHIHQIKIIKFQKLVSAQLSGGSEKSGEPIAVGGTATPLTMHSPQQLSPGAGSGVSSQGGQSSATNNSAGGGTIQHSSNNALATAVGNQFNGGGGLQMTRQSSPNSNASCYQVSKQ
jgi:hypothetical protein